MPSTRLSEDGRDVRTVNWRLSAHQTEREGCMLCRGEIHRGQTWSRIDEKPQSGILEGELETETEETIQTGCLD